MVAPAVVQICLALAGSALIVQHIAKPRLPIYKLQIRGLPVLTKSAATGEWTTAVTTGVELFNANFMHLDVHALSFDLFAERTDDKGRQVLRHVGSLRDKHQHQTTVITGTPPNENHSSALPRPLATSKQTSSLEGAAPLRKGKSPVMWSIDARSDFTTTTTLYLSMNVSALLRSLAQLAYQWWSRSGRLTLPSTGVAHIRAAVVRSSNATQPLPSSLPLTVSIICDNLLDTWQLRVTGTKCVMHQVVPGWSDLPKAAASVRDYAVATLLVNATGGVLYQTSQRAS